MAQTPDGFQSDLELPEYEVKATDNVYSYFMFITPTERKKEGSNFTTDVIMAYVLLFLSFLFQGILIYVIFNETVMDNIEWQHGVVKGKGSGLNLVTASHGTCNDGGSLCFEDASGMVSCAPPSVQLSGRWEELDVNGDGIWSRDEVMQKRKDLKCQFAVDPLEVFDSFTRFLLSREHLIWLHPEVKAGNMIHKPYFTYAMGDIVMCGYGMEDMCPNLLQAGVFDAPLKYHTSPRVGTTIDSALDYCIRLLEEGGTCEEFLPSTYATWKTTSTAQCGEPEYEKFTYFNPGNNVTKSLLEVNYSAPQEFERSKTLLFKMFKGTIVFMWILAMLFEFKQIFVIVTWVLRFPDAAAFGEDAVKEEPDPTDPGDVKYIIQGITMSHRCSVALVVFLRAVMTAILFYVGVCFLAKQNEYVDLLLDGVALIFIVEIATILYTQVLRPDVRDQTESLDPMHVNRYGLDWLNRRPAIEDMLWLLAMVIIVVCILVHQHYSLIIPVTDALECTCVKKGHKCAEAYNFSPEFWEQYWSHDIPAVYDEVQRMSGGGGPVVSTAQAEEPKTLPESVARARAALDRISKSGVLKDEQAATPAPPAADTPAPLAAHFVSKGRRLLNHRHHHSYIQSGQHEYRDLSTVHWGEAADSKVLGRKSQGKAQAEAELADAEAELASVEGKAQAQAEAEFVEAEAELTSVEAEHWRGQLLKAKM